MANAGRRALIALASFLFKIVCSVVQQDSWQPFEARVSERLGPTNYLRNWCLRTIATSAGEGYSNFEIENHFQQAVPKWSNRQRAFNST